MKKLLLLLLIVPLCSFNWRYFYMPWKLLYTPKSFWWEKESYDKKKSITLDGRYILFTRSLCRPRTNVDFYSANFLTRRSYASADWCNCAGKSQSLEMIEREYILMDTVGGRMIYITAFPAFRTDSGFVYDQEVFTDAQFVNLWYANRFHLGMYDANSGRAKFASKDAMQPDGGWKISLAAGNAAFRIDSLTVDEPVTILGNGSLQRIVSMNSAEAPEVLFVRQPAWKLGFQQMLNAKPLQVPDDFTFEIDSPARLYFDDENNLYFSTPHPDPKDSTDPVFKNNRVYYSPEKLFD